MRKVLIAVLAALFTGVFIAETAEARRLGGARSLGVQRNVTPPPARPAPQQQAAPAGQQQAAPAAAGAQGAAAGASGSRWMPMLGGLALGGMLGWLFAGNGLGGILLLALLAFGAVMLFRALAHRTQPQARAQYAGGGHAQVGVPPVPSPVPGTAAPSGQGSLPRGFDAEGFLRAAKTNFVKLQLANDAGDLDEIRDFTTPQMFEALSADILERAGERQETDVSGLEAELLEVKSEGGTHWVSVGFSGLVREAAGAQAQPFSEVWHLAKPMDGSSGWLLAGIQQPH